MKVNKTLKHVLATALFMLPLSLAGQAGIDSLLRAVEENNPRLSVFRLRTHHQRLANRIGNALPNPTVEIDYDWGSPRATAGNQLDIVVMQSFAFPSVYKRRSELISTQAQGLELDYQSERREVLLEAKLSALKIEYLNLRAYELARRLENATQISNLLAVRMREGEATALETNKAAIELFTAETALSGIEAERAQLIELLKAMSGGEPLLIADTLAYPNANFPSFDSLWAEWVSNDAELQGLQNDVTASEAALRLERAARLPQFQAGYHHQSLLGQTFNGAAVGFSIPLWENRYRVEAQAAEVTTSRMAVNSYSAERLGEARGLYERYVRTAESLERHQAVLANTEGRRLLYRAVELGQITILEYFTQLSTYYATIDAYQLLLLECQILEASLLRHQL